MIQRILTAYYAECLKAIRWKFSYLGPLLVVAMVLFAPLVQPIQRDGSGDYGFIAFATPMALNLLGLILLLSFCACLISSETASGTIRLVLVRPILRHEYLAAKFLLGLSYALLLTAMTSVSSWLLVALFGDLSGVEYGGEVLYTGAQMATTYFFGILLTLAPQAAAVAYAIFISVVTRSTGASVGASIGIWVVLDAVKYPLHIAPALFSTYFETPWQVFSSRCVGVDAAWTPGIYACLAASLGSFALFTTLSMLILRRRSLQG